MNDLMLKQSLPIDRKEYNGQPVLTFRDIDTIHHRPEGSARKRFNDNKKYFVEGIDFFVRNQDEASSEYGILAPNGLKLFTQTGSLMIVQSFTDDLSWAIQRELVTGYFAARRAGMTFMGTPVMPLADAARSLGLSPRTARERVMRGGFGMGDALLLEGRNFTRFKAENAQPHFPAKSLWIVTRSGYEKLKTLITAPQLATQP